MADWSHLGFEPEEADKKDNLGFEPEEAPAPEAPKPGYLQSGLRGAAQGATLGFSDEMMGALKAGGQAAMEAGGNLAHGESPVKPFADIVEKYRNARDAERQANKDAEEANPKTYMASELAGGLATPGVGELKGVMGAAKLGGLMGLGTSEGDLTKGEFGEPALKTAIGATGGALVGAGMDKLGKILGNRAVSEVSKAATPLGELANRAQSKAGSEAVQMLEPASKALRQTISKGIDVGDSEMASAALKYKLPDAYRTGGAEGAYNAVKSSLEANRQEFEPILDQVAQAWQKDQPGLLSKLPDFVSLADKSDEIADKYIERASKGFGGKASAEGLARDFDEFRKQLTGADLNIKDLQELKIRLGSQLKELDWNKLGGELPEKKMAVKELYGLVKGRIEQLADVVEPKLGQHVKYLNGEYGALSNFEAPLEKKLGVQAVEGKPGLLGVKLSPTGRLKPVIGERISEVAGGMKVNAYQKMADVLQGIDDSEASSLANKLMAYTQSPEVLQAGKMLPIQQFTEKLSPKEQHLMMQAKMEIPKDVTVRPPASLIPDKAKNAGYLESNTADDIERIKTSIPDNGSEQNNAIRNILETAKGRDQQGRAALMFALKQNPVYRKMLDDAAASRGQPKNERSR